MNKAIAISLIGLFFHTTTAWGQTAKLKTVFIYNFTKYIDWPESLSQGDFQIAIIGSSPLTHELKVLAKTRKVGSQTMKVTQYKSAQEAVGAHMIIISPGQSRQLASVISATNRQSTLIITEGNGLVKRGSCISMVVQGNKLSYEISKRNIESRSLMVSNHLLNLGQHIQ